MLEQDRKVDYVAQYQAGITTFAKLFRLWMDTNQWSHPVMTSLFRSALDGAGWLHSSQISGFRHGKTANPGPRAFIAIERLNFFLYRYKTTHRLIPNTPNSNHYSDPFVILEDGEPPSVGWWFEVFTGVRVPKDYILSGPMFSETEAERFTRAFARLIRRLMALKGYDPIDDLGRLLRDFYPTRDSARTAQLTAVIRGTDIPWTGEQLREEIPALSSFTAALGGPETEDDLLDLLQRQQP